MKRVIAFIILYSSFVILCPGTKAQWDGAEVQRLTYNDVPNTRIHEFCIDENDNLYLFYVEGIRDTATGFVYRSKLLFRSKGNDDSWSQPEETGSPDGLIWGTVRVGYDVKTGITHLASVVNRSLAYDTMYYTNSEIPDWQLVKIDSLSNDHNARYESVAMGFDTLGSVHLVWNVDFDSIGSSWYRVMYANNSTGEWVKQQVSPPIWLGGMGIGPAQFTVQKNGVAHIAYLGEPYCGLECQSFYVRNDSLNSTDWVRDTIPKPPRPLWHHGVGPIKADANDRIHLITGGCIEEDCVEPGRHRTFYYFKHNDDSVWQGPEQIPDTSFGFHLGIEQLLIDGEGTPYVSYATGQNEVYFTDRKQGTWKVPYTLVGWQEDPDSLMVDGFSFVLDSEGQGHGALLALDIRQAFDNDSAEIYYLSCSNSAVDTSPEASPLDFRLSQNYPNPFNSSTIISYEIPEEANVTLRVYDVLGREVKELANIIHKQGHHRLIWDGRNNQGKGVASGIYFYQLKARDYKQTKRMLLIK